MKRLWIISFIAMLACSPLLAERIVKVEALSTDTTTFRQNKIQLNMAELAAQLVPYQSSVDTTLFALLAGDADGQTIQGDAGANKARLSLGGDGMEAGADAMLQGDGAAPAMLILGESFAQLRSGDNASTVDVSNGSAGMQSDGAVTLNSNGATFSVYPTAVFGGRLPVRIKSAATLDTCDSGIAIGGSVALMWDTTGGDLCVCNGSVWTAVDGTGTCE